VDPRLARRAAAAAFVAGLGADVLFDRVGLGINVPLATAATLALVTWFSTGRRPADRLDLWLPLVAMLAAFGPALRTDPSVIGLDLGIVAIATAAWGVAVGGVSVTRRAASRVALLGCQAGLVTTVALAWLVTRSGADGFFSRGFGQLGRVAPIARGALIALPVLAGFSLLLSSADAVFGRALDDALHLPVDLGEAVHRGVFSILAAGLIAGPIALAAGAADLFTWSGLASSPAPAATGEAEPAARPRRIGAVEALVVLVAVDLLFAAFAVVQVVYLFGGVDTLAAVGMTYSDYARQGYFQLVGVVGLAGLLLLGAHEVVGRTRAFLIGAVALLALTAVILASAALRLALYQGAYGWTELRFFVAASIAWLAICVGLAAGLLLADRMRWLPHFLAGSAVAVALAVSAIGPQAFVMHENLARVVDPRLVAPGGFAGLDLEYGLTLGDDAIPDLVTALAVLPPLERDALLVQLGQRRAELADDPETAGLLSWNLARERARAALAELPTP
jgi:two-component system sensor histidine kinase BaeS